MRHENVGVLGAKRYGFYDIREMEDCYNIDTNFLINSMEKQLKRASACSMSIIQGNNAYVRATGRLSLEDKSNNCNIHSKFHISSLTKLFTGYLVEKLVKEGYIKYESTLEDVVDIDSNVEDIFDLFCQNCHTDVSNISLIIDDAFNYLKQTRKTYDFIVVDIFCDDRMLDFLTSFSFWRKVYEHVSENGIVVWNTKMRNWFFSNEKDNPMYSIIDEVYMDKFKAIYLSPLHSGGWLYICKNKADLLAQTKKLCECCDNKYLEAALITNSIYMRHFPPRQKCERQLEDISDRYSDFIFAGLVNYGRKKTSHRIVDPEGLFMKEVYNNYRNKRKRLDIACREEYFEELWELLSDIDTFKMDSIMLPCEELIHSRRCTEAVKFFKDMSLYFSDEKFEIDGLRKMQGYTMKEILKEG